MSEDEQSDPIAQQLYRWYAHAEPEARAREVAVDRIVAEVHPGRAARTRDRQEGRRIFGAGLAAAALILTVFGSGILLRARFQRSPSDLVTVELQVTVPSAHRVDLAGDFNGWDARKTPMTQDPATGMWRATLRLPPGRHAYSYLVDGTRWVVDAAAPQSSDAEFGGTNVLAVAQDGVGDE